MRKILIPMLCFVIVGICIQVYDAFASESQINLNITSSSIAPEVSGTATIDASLGNGLVPNGSVQINIDGGSYEYMVSNGSGWQTYWDTTGYINGTHIITIYVKDIAGNIVSQTKEVVVNNT